MTDASTLLALSASQTLGLYVGLPALLFSLIALIAFLTSKAPAGRGDVFPRLRPPQELTHNDGRHARGMQASRQSIAPAVSAEAAADGADRKASAAAPFATAPSGALPIDEGRAEASPPDDQQPQVGHTRTQPDTR